MNKIKTLMECKLTKAVDQKKARVVWEYFHEDLPPASPEEG